jgi:PmbA protein
MTVEQLIQIAMQKAQGAQVLIEQSESTEVAFENDALKSVESSQSTQIKVKVVMNGQIGVSETTDIDDLDGVVTRALEVAQFGSQCHFSFPSYQQGETVKVYDEGMTQLTKTAMIQIGQDMQGVIKAYNPALIFKGGLNKDMYHKTFANSSGAYFSEESTSLLLWGLGLRVRDNELFETWHGFKSKARNINHIAAADRAVEMMRNAENNAHIQSGTIPVIFAPTAMDVLLLPLRLGLDGKHIFTGYSPMGDAIDQQIANKCFTLIDHPLIDYAPNSSAYDDEGVPHRVLPLIDKGVVCNFLYDLDSASRAGTQSNGHGEGRDTTNLLIKPGVTSYADMVKNTQEGLLVYYVMGLGQGNPVSGDFSVGIRLGYKIENGELVGLVKDAMLTGNAFDALNNIISMSKEIEQGLGWYVGQYPYIQIGGLNIVTR